MRAPFFGLNASRSSALSTGSPRIWSATSRPFWADRRTPRSVAVVCIAVSLPSRRRRRGGRNLPVGRVALERARHRELSQLVADHVLRHVDRDVLLAVVDGDRQADEFRRDRRTARPGLDRLLVVDGARGFHLLHQMIVDERALLDRTCHWLSLCSVPTAHDHHVGALVAARLVAFGRRAPRRDRMATAIRAAAMRMIDRVHRDAAHRRSNAAPTLRAGFTDRAQAVLFIADFADRRATVDMYLADLTRAEPQLRVGAFAREQLHAGARRPRELSAFARLHLDAMDRRADRHVAQRNRVAPRDRRL